MTAPRIVHVAVAVIRDAAGRVLVAQRLPHQHLAGLWEFPGGKLEAGESLFDGMVREIREELGVTVQAIAPLLRIEHAYPEKTVLLDVWRITRWQGEPHGAEGQPLRWVYPDDMLAEEYPPADVPIIAALRLPPRYVISPDITDDEEATRFVEALVRVDARLVQVRLKAAPRRAPALVASIRSRLPAARILLNSDTQAALGGGLDALHGADGLHLTATALTACTQKPAALCAASCHDARELALAFVRGIDFATLSPVLPTASHPGAGTLGWEKFAALAAGAGLPVYALGGMHDDVLADALASGAIGIAGIRGMLRDPE